MNCIQCGVTIPGPEETEYCPACGTQEQSKTCIAKKRRFPMLALIPMVICIGIAVMLISTYFEGKIRESKGYDAVASSELIHVQTRCEEALLNSPDLNYPEAVEKIQGYRSVNGVVLTYQRSTDMKSYVMTAYHQQGKRIYRVTSGSSQTMWREKKQKDADYRPL